jgi:mannan endo-1,4-beta-mannosidase
VKLKKDKLMLTKILLSILLLSSSAFAEDFVTVKGTKFFIGEKEYEYLGANFWYGFNLGSPGKHGNRERLHRELDRLKALNVTNLRIMAASEGPDQSPYRMLPALQPSPGKYNEDLLIGLDYLLKEMAKRKMKAVMVLNNFWPWSGGMGQYLVWTGDHKSIPYPPPHPGGSWSRYQLFTSQFYKSQKAKKIFMDHVRFITNRVNSLTGLPYKEDSTIMSWQLANEPRPIANKRAFAQWVSETAAFIKSQAPKQLVSLGSEGETRSGFSGNDFKRDHQSKDIDYTTIHIWVQNAGIYNPFKAKQTYPTSIRYALNKIALHEKYSREMNKPTVLEEFGISRDLNSHSPLSPTTVRDQYFETIFSEISSRTKDPLSSLQGSNFWAWGGEGRPRTTKENLWKLGDDFIGDPPHETQGWYSIYDKDTSTLKILKKYSSFEESTAR